MTTRRFLHVFFIFSLLVFIQAVAGGAWASTPCRQGKDVHVWISPQTPQPGVPMEILAVATAAEPTDLQVTPPAGDSMQPPAARGGGPPWSLRAELPAPIAGRYRVEARRDGNVVSCTEVRVGGETAERGAGQWDLPTQALYAAWVEHLFDAPPDVSLNFPSLEPVLRDPERNFLHGYLRRGEDAQITAEPDCADLPYFLRAYFAWKLGLPVAYRPCSRGTASSPPTCGAAKTDLSLAAGGATAADFNAMTRQLVNTVHSGSARTALRNDATDFYPVPLERSALWPGTVFADPYGHTLVIAKWVPQTQDRPGLLLAVDAQPDNSVARKRYWQGNFLFAPSASAGPGFKAYRAPVSAAGGNWRLLPNEAIDGQSGLPPYSTEQADLALVEFYARLERLINPRGLEPEEAYFATLEALLEQLETRVRSVKNGERYMRAHPDLVVAMPEGPAIFETMGPWEDYATPARDMRLLIAMNILTDVPERIRRHPELYVLGDEDPAVAAARIERLHDQSIEERAISYTRSDGSTWRLSLAEIYRRRPALEIAYNPNDCVERRWGAVPGTPDFATCRRRAPAEQIARMEEYRPWFRETRRPPR